MNNERYQNSTVGRMEVMYLSEWHERDTNPHLVFYKGKAIATLKTVDQKVMRGLEVTQWLRAQRLS